MSTPPQLPVPDPDLRALLQAFKIEILASLNCHQWGVIKGFSAAKQTVTVQIAVTRQVPVDQGGQAAYQSKPYPLLVDVPVFIASGGPGFLTFPIATGDICLVLFNDRDFDQFWATGNIQDPNSARMHDLSDGLAIIGFRTAANPLAAYDPLSVVLANGTTQLRLAEKIILGNDITNLTTILTNWINVLKAFVDTRGDTPNPATLTALTGIQNQINTLFQ
jgi:hypothetical protein